MAVLKDESGLTARQLLRVQRQEQLQALQGIHDDRAQHVEEQQGDRVLLPGHLLAGIDAAEAIQESFKRPPDAQCQVGTAFHDVGDVAAQRLDAQHGEAQYGRKEQIEQDVGVHQNFSARMSA